MSFYARVTGFFFGRTDLTAAAAVFPGRFDGGVCFAFAADFGAGRTGFTAAYG